MSRNRNVALSLVAAGALLVSVLVLLPEPADAARIDLASSSISQLYGNDNRIDLTFSVDIPAGEHIPLDRLRVNMIQGTAALHANGLLGYSGGTTFAPTVTCKAAVATSGTPRLEIVSVTGGTVTVDVHRGYGYSVSSGPGYNLDGDFGGYGYSYTGTATDVFAGAGSGPGYAGGTSGTVLTVRATLHGCGDAVTFTGPRADVTFQAYFGDVPGPVLPSLPVHVRFYSNPTQAPVPDVVAPPEVTYSGDGRGATIAFVDGEPGNAPIQLAVNPGNGPATVSLSRTDTPLPQGTRLVVATSGDAETTSFGAAQQAVSTQRQNILNQGRTIADQPAVGFRFLLDVPGTGLIDPSVYFGSMDVQVDVEVSAFDLVGGPSPARFAVFGFSSVDGSAKPNHPSVMGMQLINGGTTARFDVRITDFSSFQGYAASQPITGGGPPYVPPEVTTTPSSTTTSTTTTDATTNTTTSTTSTSTTSTTTSTTTTLVPDPDLDPGDEEPDVPDVDITETETPGVQDEGDPDEGGTPWLWIIVGGVGLALVGTVVVLMLRRK